MDIWMYHHKMEENPLIKHGPGYDRMYLMNQWTHDVQDLSHWSEAHQEYYYFL